MINVDNYIYNLGLKFSACADRHSNNIAINYPQGKSVSFSALDEMSNRWADFLKKQNIKYGDVVTIFNTKSLHGYALMLGCLKIGAIYTNLDTSSPWLRIHKILETCNPSIIFLDEMMPSFHQELLESASHYNLVEIFDDNTQAELTVCSTDLPLEVYQVTGASPAYIMFTSGSTGFPKGAVMSHQNVLNFIQWAQSTFSLDSSDILTNANPIYFDNSVFDFYASLFNGACLVPLSHELVRNPSDIVQAINDAGCTTWFSVPSLLVYLLTTRVLNKTDFHSVKRIIFGGEGFPKNKLKDLFELFGDRISLYNVYGPTECTCICSSYQITDIDFKQMDVLAPLGKLAPNFGYVLLPLEGDNEDSKLGELCLTGPCVGLGYFNDSERTAASFIQNPASLYRDIIYRSGDIVREDNLGYLHFKGRVDNQIKHMGYRIELEEIEAALNALVYVNEAGVVYHKISGGLGQICAFVHTQNADVTSEQILVDLKLALPPYMLPKKIRLLEKLPKNANGKTDRIQLAALL
ncbi:MAG: AMP-binding protein [Chitinophagaceae bacterium]|nr:AMP-binding protein [Chitinophagaceae bacterium]